MRNALLQSLRNGRIFGASEHSATGILPRHSDGDCTMTDLSTMTREQLLALVSQMQAVPAKRTTCKVSPKGGLSLYGLGRFPITLYRSQWERLLSDDTVMQVKAFITANDKLLAVKV
jgi:hypothetical protein